MLRSDSAGELFGILRLLGRTILMAPFMVSCHRRCAVAWHADIGRAAAAKAGAHFWTVRFDVQIQGFMADARVTLLHVLWTC
jgi:hypothetical protein